MEDKIEKSDFTLLVCTPSFSQLVRASTQGSTYNPDAGVLFEGKVIYSLLLHSTDKFIPLLFEHKNPESIVPALRGSPTYGTFLLILLLKLHLLINSVFSNLLQ
jgi:hypothetical protein